MPNFLAGLIIFFSATQLGLHFWPLSSLVYGIRIDYLSPTLYFLDLLIILYLLQRRLLDRRPEQSSSWDAEGGRSLLTGTIPILLLNLLYSQNPLATLSWSLHFLLYLLFLRTVLSPRSDLVGHPTRSDLTGVLKMMLPLALLFQLLLALSQVTLGHSVGGPMYYLGERSVAVGAPAVALGTFMDSVVLRAYGTFGHPNVLAGWSVITLLILLRLRGLSSQARFPWFPTTLATFLVFLTQSRSAALALFGLIIPFYVIKKLKFQLIYFSIFFCSLFYVLPALTPPRSDLSLSQRLDLQGLSLKVIHQFPIFGAGAQASITTYPNISPAHRLLQPDHNSFTLFLSWFGLFGVLAILYSLGSFNIRHSIFFVLPLPPLLLLDHYFLTSPQGLFVLLLYLSLALNYSHVQNHR